MIKNLITSVLLISAILVISPAEAATTYYVRCDGGTPAQCDGTHDAAQAGATDGADAGSLPDCALSSPNYVSGTNQNTGGAAGLIAAADTVIVDGELHAGCVATTKSGRAEYEVGLDAPNMPAGNNCALPFPYGCSANVWPAGTSAGFPTKIYGKGYNTGCKAPPQFWGSGSAYTPLGITSNTELKCVEITDHSGCIFRHDGYGNIDNSGSQDPITCGEPYQVGNYVNPGPYSKVGINIPSGSHDIIMDHVWVHGMSYQGINATGLTGNLSMTNVVIRGNGYVGYTGADGSNYTGDYLWRKGGLEYSGCGERYPPTNGIGLSLAAMRSPTDIHNCWTQGQGAGYGDGLGANIAWGNWTFDHIDVFGNASDGLDQLYDGTGTEKVEGITCEGNTGACYKSSAANVYVENSTLIGNCAKNKQGTNPVLYGDSSAPGRTGGCNNNGHCDANENSTTCGGDCAAYGPCRPANHTPLSIGMQAGSTVNIYGNTITGNSDVIIYVSSNGSNATSNLRIKNNLIVGATEYNGGESDTADFYYQDGTGAPTLTQDYNVIAHTKTWSTDCIGAHDQCFANESSLNLVGPISNFGPTYYTGTSYITAYYLQVTSPAHSATAADETVTLQGSAFDSTGFNRRATWDAGGIEYRPTLHLSTDYYSVSQ